MLATARILLIKIGQFYSKHGSLYLVKARVDTNMREDILVLGAIIAKHLYHIGKMLVVGSYASTIAKGTKILARTKAVASCIAK